MDSWASAGLGIVVKANAKPASAIAIRCNATLIFMCVSSGYVDMISWMSSRHCLTVGFVSRKAGLIAGASVGSNRPGSRVQGFVVLDSRWDDASL